MAICIVNPRSAGGATGRRWGALAAHLAQLGIPVEARFTSGAGDATRLATAALREGADWIVAVGGDGTLNEVVEGLMAADPSRARLGILPSGTGGDTIRTLGIPSDPFAAAGILALGHERTLDVGVARFAQGERHFLNIAEAGLGGAVVARVNRTTKVFGGFASFLSGTLLTFASYPACRMTLTLEDEPPRTLRAWNLVVANGAYFGGGMKVLPEARMDDGWFDVMLVGDVPRRALFANVARLYRGTHLSQPGVEHFRARELRLESDRPLLLDLDGEQPGTTPVRFSLRPRALRVVAPPSG